MGQLTASYDAGTAAAPLVGDTIGVALQKMVVAQPDVEALVSRHQGVRFTYRELGTRSSASRAACSRSASRTGDRVGIWSPNCAEWTLLQFATAPGSGRSSSTSTRRTGRTSSPTRSRHSGVRMLVTAESFKTSRLPRDARSRCGPSCRSSSGSSRSGEAAGGGPDDLVWPRWSICGSGDPGRSGALTARRQLDPTTRSTSSTRAARPATRRARPSRTTTS